MDRQRSTVARICGAVASLVLVACSDPLQGAGFSSISQSRSDASVLYTAVNSLNENVGIYRSDDGGASWKPTAGAWWEAIGRNGPSGASVARVAVSPFNSNVVLIGTAVG